MTAPACPPLTPEELALLRLGAGDPLPAGGQVLDVVVRSGTGSASAWIDLFAPVFRERFGVALLPGSLNLWADAPVTWERPAVYAAGGAAGQFCPVILDERAVGVAFRLNEATPTFLEVLSPVRLRTRLADVADGERIAARLLPGDLLLNVTEDSP